MEIAYLKVECAFVDETAFRLAIEKIKGVEDVLPFADIHQNFIVKIKASTNENLDAIICGIRHTSGAVNIYKFSGKKKVIPIS